MEHSWKEVGVNNQGRKGRQENCRYCGSSRTVLNGVRKGEQLRRCNACRTRQGEKGAMGGHSYTPDQIGAGIEKFYTALSSRRAAKLTEERFGMESNRISPQTVINWTRQYTDVAVALARGCQAAGGGMWSICRRSLGLYPRMWWIVVDGATDYILASCLDDTMTEDVARRVLRQALDSAVKPCDDLVYRTDWSATLGTYDHIPESEILTVLQETLPDKKVTKYASNPFVTSDFHPWLLFSETLYRYPRACRAFNRVKDNDSLRRYISGWAITSNLRTGSMKSGGRAPVQAAGVKLPFGNWADVVRLKAKAYLPAGDA